MNSEKEKIIIIIIIQTEGNALKIWPLKKSETSQLFNYYRIFISHEDTIKESLRKILSSYKIITKN